MRQLLAERNHLPANSLHRRLIVRDLPAKAAEATRYPVVLKTLAGALNQTSAVLEQHYMERESRLTPERFRTRALERVRLLQRPYW